MKLTQLNFCLTIKIILLQPIQSPEKLNHELMWCGLVSWDGTSSKLSGIQNSVFDSGFFSSSQILGNQTSVKQLIATKRCIVGVTKNGRLFRVPYINNSEVRDSPTDSKYTDTKVKTGKNSSIENQTDISADKEIGYPR
jgi:hypothetical protein